MPSVWIVGLVVRGSRSIYWVGSADADSTFASDDEQHAIFDYAVASLVEPCGVFIFPNGARIAIAKKMHRNP